MKVVIAGGSGFLGTALTRELVARGHQVVILSRQSASAAHGARFVAWHPSAANNQDWSREIDGADAVVNLAGAGIADKRWTTARKAELRESRIASTRALVRAVHTAARKPGVFVQASGIGYYGVSGDELVNESSPAGTDFLASLCVRWEAEGRDAREHGVRLVTIRNGIVLAREGGALKKMLLPFQLGLGGPIASGRQYMSWIQLDDWVGMVIWAISTAAVEGALNATAPEPVTNAVFTRALGAALHRPAVLPMPAFALRLLVGELADAGLSNGQRVVPARALELGFRFKYPDIGTAMAASVGGRGAA